MIETSPNGSQRKQVLSKKNGMINVPRRQDSVPPLITGGNESKVSGALDHQHSLNLTPLKSPEGYDHTNMSVSPTMVNNTSPSKDNEQKLKQARLSLPVVSDRSHGGHLSSRLPNSMPGSQDSTPINAKVAMHFESKPETTTNAN